jgi:hypothetical protein
VPLPRLPAQGDTNWYSWASGVHDAVARIADTVRDVIGASLVAGSNVTITHDDGDTFTIASTSGSGSGRNAFVDIMASGALGDGSTDDTEALQTFIDANVGTIIIWPEKTFAVTQLLLPSHTHLELGNATIRRRGNRTGAAHGATLRNTDQTDGNTDITVRGGTITGTKGTSGRPWVMRRVTTLRVQDVHVDKGDADFADWMFVFEHCTNVRVDNCRVSGGTAVGEDGLHIASMQDGVITNCIIESGDDALAMFQEFGQTRPTKNVTISNMILSSQNANALRLGVKSTERFGVEDITLSNIAIRPPARGRAGGTCMTIGDETYTGLVRRINMSNFSVDATGYAGNAVNISSMLVDSTFSNWRIHGASNRSLILDDCHRLTFTNVVADTPAEDAGNPQWSITEGCTNIHHVGCEVRDARIWGWTISGAGTSDISFIGCRSINSAQQAWSVSHATRLTIMGCTVNGGASPVTCDTTDPPTLITMLGNNFSGYSGTPVVNAPARLIYLANSDDSDASDPINSATLGFYGSPPITQPTGVPITAAGIHAALVSLGLISD